MLTTPPTFGTSRGVLDLNSSSLVGTCKTQLYGRELHSLPQWQKLNSLPSCSNPKSSNARSDFNLSTSWSALNFSTPWSDPNFSASWSELNSIFFQNLPNSQLGMTSSTLQPYFLCGVYYDWFPSHHSTNTLGKGMNPIILPSAMGKL